MNINQATIDLVKRFEGFRSEAYRDPVGIWTIGFGTTAKAGLGIKPRKGMRITEQMAEALLIEGLEKFAKQIRPMFTNIPNDNQFGAMLSLAYNIGPGAFEESTCLRRFNDGDEKGAAEALMWFNKAGGKVLNGLVRRRQAEYELFMTPPRKFSEDTPERKQAPDIAKPESKPSGLLEAIFAFIAKLFGGKS